MSFGFNMNEPNIEYHLMKALIELDLVREEYIYRKNKQKSDEISYLMKEILSRNRKLSTMWDKEQSKWI